jgi:hypothetical protein
MGWISPDTTDIDEALEITIRALSAANEMHLAHSYPGFEPYKFGYDKGKKYSRVWVDNGTQRFVCFFVQRDNGDVWKAAGWPKPALNFVRGNILSPEGRKAITFDKVGKDSCHFYHGF